MDIQTITSWLFVATMVLPLVGLPIFIIFNREKTPVETERPSQAAYAWSTVIAAVLGYGVGVSVGTGVSCSPRGWEPVWIGWLFRIRPAICSCRRHPHVVGPLCKRKTDTQFGTSG
jgi:hypothetical protein